MAEEGKGISGMSEKSDGLLQIRMFRTFSARYGDRNILDGAGKDSQFVHILQLLWYYQEQGVSRELLMEAAFGGREPDDPGHALRNALYRVKARLGKLGLPQVEYIIRKRGRFYWNRDIPVETDVHTFARLYRAAEEESDEERRLSLLQQAYNLYRGEFLSEYGNCLWVVYEARTYREQFRGCVEEAAEILRGNRNYQEMERLGQYAAMADPYADWEVLTMEALCAMGKAQEACDLYARTTDLYMRECGNLPSKELKRYVSKLDGGKEYTRHILDNIQESMEEKDMEGGYLCSALVFQSLYQIFSRMAERGGQSFCLMLCTVMEGKGRPAQNAELLSRFSDSLCLAIQKAVRHCDVVSRYGQNQYLILLVNISLEDCGLVQQRVNQYLKEEALPFYIEYYANNLIPRSQ